MQGNRTPLRWTVSGLGLLSRSRLLRDLLGSRLHEQGVRMTALAARCLRATARAYFAFVGWHIDRANARWEER